MADNYGHRRDGQDARTGYGGGNKAGDPPAPAGADAPGRMHNLKTTGVADPYSTDTGYARMPQQGNYAPPTGKPVADPTTGDGPTNLGSGPYAGTRGRQSGSGR
jgi:hypothetical protein